VVLAADHQPATMMKRLKSRFTRQRRSSGAKSDHLASASGVLRDAVQSSRCHSAQPGLDPSGHCHTLCRRSMWRERGEEQWPRTPSTSRLVVRRSTFDGHGERKILIIGESDDFRPLAALVGPTARTFCRRERGVDKSLLQLQSPGVCVTARPVHARCAPACLPLPAAGRGNGISGTVDTCWPVHSAG